MTQRPFIDMRVRTEGPIFQGVAGRHIKMTTRRIVRKTAELGEQRLNRMLRPRPGGVYLTVEQAGKNASTGHYRRNLHTAVRELNARIDDGGVVYGPWLEGVGSRNSRTRFKGYASFRRTGDWLRKHVRRRVINAEVKMLMRRIGG